MAQHDPRDAEASVGNSSPVRPGAARAIEVVDLAGVVYSSGKVFDGLSTGRLDTENFLRSGSLDGVTSRSDLALLEDLRDVAAFIIERGRAGASIDASFVRAVNATITRSGALRPGRFRSSDEQIGVSTRYGRHEPPALDDTSLQHVIEQATDGPDPLENALNLFVDLAKAQPFQDGNKRTALFTANALLIVERTNRLLAIPVDENDPALADRFNDLLARAYVLNEHEGVKNLLRTQGFRSLPAQ